ncbi:hypothetical protein [Superficieibacter sp. 1612_C1]|jgi:hypothetical protein|uniref:hypothetical protein n=1 Tax=Superficieibacter sp. 1612_C1 TaxID=2780382 RepID=UPI0018841C49|nr:hypothetical protein [Superficieibacter sp. 1612_C1]
MRLQTILLLSGILNLTGCVVADMDSSNYRYVPWIQVFQKVDSTGQTNIRERKEALYSCGVDRSENLDDKNWGLNIQHGNETLKESVDRNQRIFRCMESKGYQVYGFDECGPLKKPSGLCPN